jgi:hypothetical protein
VGDIEIYGMQSFFVPVRLPGLNDIILAKGQYYRKGKKRFEKYQAMKREYEGLIISAIQLAKIKPVKRAYFQFTWIEDNKMRDPDNVAAARKFILDALVVAGVLSGDGWKQVAGWTDTFTVKEGNQKSGVGVAIWADGRG